ncbi:MULTISPECIES: hypothetical protein [Rhodopseudomonas]|uniref:hypothetical protein n=1 Tax=Rhodopseudomonas TaxID=1073 RepID=UPI001FCED473|nr:MULTISPECIES: hypothetical protein [Rhodopseudomonas]
MLTKVELSSKLISPLAILLLIQSNRSLRVIRVKSVVCTPPLPDDDAVAPPEDAVAADALFALLLHGKMLWAAHDPMLEMLMTRLRSDRSTGLEATAVPSAAAWFPVVSERTDDDARIAPGRMRETVAGCRSIFAAPIAKRVAAAPSAAQGV